MGTLAGAGAIKGAATGALDLMSDVVAFGECMVEVGLTGPTQAVLGYAGDTFNTTVYLRRLGLSAAYATAVGEGDPFSAGMRRFMAEEGIETGLVRAAAGRLPGLYAFDRDEAGEQGGIKRGGRLGQHQASSILWALSFHGSYTSTPVPTNTRCLDP